MFLFPLLISLSLLVAAARLSYSSSSDQYANDSIVPTALLHNGVTFPLVGLGCASGVRKRHVSSALEVGYRLFDTAQSYNWGYHEDEVGEAIQEFRNNQRNPEADPIFVQTKIHPEDLGYQATKRAVKISLERLKLDQIDSVLIHKPRCWEGACNKVPEGTWQDSWKALEEFYDAGIIKAIGICDVYSNQMLKELLSQDIKPHIIQNWMDPLHQDTAMRLKIQSHGILYQAYSSLGTQWGHHRGHSKNPVTNHPTLLQIAEAHDADVGQVVVNWATTRHGVSVLPASTNPVRQEGNLFHSFRFVLTEEELDAIDALDGNVPKVEDTNEVSVVFKNEDDPHQTIDVYWIDHEDAEFHVGSISAGRELSLNSYYGHTFRFKDQSNGSAIPYSDITIKKGDGKKQVHIISRDDEEL